MKVNIEFYKESIVHIKEVLNEYEADLESFKTICGSVFKENWYGFKTGSALKSVADTIYDFSSGEITRIFGNTASVVEEYIEDMAREDKL